MILENKQDLAERAAEIFCSTVDAAATSGGGEPVCVALSGGSTPKALYALLASKPWVERIPWDRVRWFFGDERCVPSDDEASNYRMVKETLFDKAGVSPDNVFRIKTELAVPRETARDYGDVLRKNVSRFNDAGFPVFDLMLLGMGDDGHTASLFPFTEGLKEREKFVVANHVEKLDTWRISMTRPVIEAAENKMVLITGAGKAEALAAVRRGERDEDRYPAQMLRDLGNVVWLVDKNAARLLDD